MTTTVTVTNNAHLDPFASLSELESQHITLMREIRSAPAEGREVDLIAPFLQRAQATGARIDDLSERDIAQSILDYWMTVLIHSRDRAALPAALCLAEFDLSQADDLVGTPSPFKGLNAFQEADADWFFGRGDAVKALIDTVSTQPLVVVAGPSGSGKSSLVLAGIVPSLQRGALPGSAGWHYFPTVTPGADPLASLLQIVRGNQSDVPPRREAQKSMLLRSPSGFAEFIKPGDRPAVLVIDQFEELFTLCSDSSTRTTFVEALLSVLQTDGRNRLILTIRDDFIEQARLLPGLGAPNAYFMPPLFTPPELRRIIEEPANRIGLKIAGSIVDDLVTEVHGDPTALPLLQFTLKQLWEHRTRNRVTWEMYRKVGKPSEALKRTAEKVFDDLRTFENHQTAERIFLALAQPSAGAEFLRRKVFRATLEALEAPDRVNRVLQRFVDAGLVIEAPGAERGEDRFEVAHETLIRNWPRLAEWLRNKKATSEKLTHLIATARLWQRSGNKDGYLLRGSALAEAKPFQDQASELQELVITSERAEERRKSLRSLALFGVVAFSVATGVAMIAFYRSQAEIAEERRRTAITAVQGVIFVVKEQLSNSKLPMPVAKSLLDVLLKTETKIFEDHRAGVYSIKLRLSTLIELSDAFVVAHDYDNGLLTAEKIKKIAKSMTTSDPSNIDWRCYVYRGSFRVGDRLEGSIKGKTAREYLDLLTHAEMEYNEALNIADELAKTGDYKKCNSSPLFIRKKIADVYRRYVEYEFNAEVYSRKFISEYRYVADEYAKIAQENPGNPNKRRDAATAQTSLGEAYETLKETDKAEERYRSAVDSLRELVVLDRRSGSYRSNLARALDRLSAIYKKNTAKLDDALDLGREALETRKTLVADFPSNADYLVGLIRGYNFIGDVLVDKMANLGNRAEADALREQARLAYNNVISPPLSQDRLDLIPRMPKIITLQQEVRKKLQSLDVGTQ